MKRNKTFDTMKALAIFSIICAHLSPINSNNFITVKLSILFNSIGALGVSVFFLISGYFFAKNKYPLKKFFKKKIKYQYIPWVFIGTIVYISVFFFQNTLSFVNYLKFLIGYGSYLYYLTVLNILYLLYYKLKKNNFWLILSSIFSLISIFYTIINGMNSFSYLNIFNWIIYFNIGISLNKFYLWDKFEDFCSKNIIYSCIILILFFVFHLIQSTSIGYWTLDGFIIILCNILFLAGFAAKMTSGEGYIGKNSLPFYLIHMPIAGVIVRITNVLEPLIILRPILTLLITYCVIKLYDGITNNKKLKKFKILIGVKE